MTNEQFDSLIKGAGFIAVVAGIVKVFIEWFRGENKRKVDIAKENSAGVTAIAELWEANKAVQRDIENLKSDSRETEHALAALKKDYEKMTDRLIDYFANKK